MIDTARRLHRFRGLVFTLTAREIKARYRGSVLGFLWSLVNPLLLLGVYTFVFGFVFPQRFEGVQPYAVFLICGLFPWIWVSTSVLDGTISLIANAGLIRKAVFPIEILPMVAVLSGLVHFVFALPLLLGAVVVSRLLGFPIGGLSCLVLPFVMLLQLPALAGIALALSALNVHFKDVRDLVNNFITLLFFLTPIIYPLKALDAFPVFWWMVRLMPFTPFTLGYQQAMFFGVVPALSLWVQMAAIAAVFWFAGTWLFRRLSETLVEAV